jgi:hypothetical protein
MIHSVFYFYFNFLDLPVVTKKKLSTPRKPRKPGTSNQGMKINIVAKVPFSQEEEDNLRDGIEKYVISFHLNEFRD